MKFFLDFQKNFKCWIKYISKKFTKTGSANACIFFVAFLKKNTTKGTLFYDRSFLTIFVTSKFEINTEDVYIFLTNHKYQYDQVLKKNS